MRRTISYGYSYNYFVNIYIFVACSNGGRRRKFCWDWKRGEVFNIFSSFGRFFNSSKYFLIFLWVEEPTLSIVCPANFASGNSSKEEKSREANWMSSKGIAFALYCHLESWNRHINWYIFDINWYLLVYLWY